MTSSSPETNVDGMRLFLERKECEPSSHVSLAASLNAGKSLSMLMTDCTVSLFWLWIPMSVGINKHV